MKNKITVALDVECYRNFFSVGVRNIETGNTKHFEIYDGQVFDRETLTKIVTRCRLITFNGNNYDMPMVFLALSGADNATLKKASDRIILGTGMKPWQFEKAYGLRFPKIDHIDLIEVAPGQASLKIYGGRVHTKKMQDLPIDPDATITPADRLELLRYNENDLNATIDLYRKLTPQIALRETMTDEYGIDLRSKSDAQIAEAILKLEIEKITGVTPTRPEFPAGTTFKYQVPDFLAYKTDTMREVLEMVRNATFVVSDTGGVEMPEELGKAKVKIGNSVYRMGIGGLHSSEETVCHFAGEDHILVDRDVASYYPSIILNQGLYLKHLGTAFLKVYKTIVDRRLKAKHSGDKVTADSLKITINGSFGKLGSKWSTLYSPHLMIQVTVTGQLALLMLIEAVELADISVVSGNTDGIVILCPKSREAELLEIIKWWESATHFETEETGYRAVFSRDVNNYVAIKPDGKVKLKGAYAEAGLQKNPANQIVVEAVVAYLKDGTPVDQTILGCDDIRKFVTVRTVKGGAVQGERYLGKAIRWYYAHGVTGALRYQINGYTVSRSDGARPLMDLPEALPDDIHYEWYINETLQILQSVGGFGGIA
jgi:DNA polymerase elongation subunit (family B)